MSKQTIKVAVISVVATLLVVGIIAAVAIPKVIDGAKTTVSSNYADEYEELAYVLDESKDPIIQTNYIITGLIMSPEFQEYLDQGVQNGWWTEEFLAQFLVDEALPIFFTNWHGLFSLILGSEPVQGAGEKVTIIKGKVQDIVLVIKGQIGKLSNFLNSPAIGNIKGLIANLEANKDKIIGLINTLQGLNLENLNGVISQLQASLGQLEDVIAAIKGLDVEELTSSVESLVSGLTSIIETIQNLDTEGLQDVIDSLKDIKATIEGIDKDQLAEDIAKLKAVIETIQNTDFSGVIDAINNILDLVEKIQNGEFDGILGDILENILNSDVIQDILGQLEMTVEGIIKLLQFYFNNFIDYTHDYNFYEPIVVGDTTIDLTDYALILNVIELDIDSSFDNGGTVTDKTDDTLTINAINVKFEINTEGAYTNILSSPVKVTGESASKINLAIPVINKNV